MYQFDIYYYILYISNQIYRQPTLCVPIRLVKNGTILYENY